MTTGVVYDRRMADHRCLWDTKYNEKPERFTSVLKRCEELQLLQRCVSIQPREATEEELLKLHTPDMITKLKSTENLMDETFLEELSSCYDFIYIHPSTYKLSLLAAGSTVELVSQILDGKVRNGMAIIRPPGHHAMKSEYCGYCFYNNVAIAAQKAIDDYGLKRILIVDWDIHHGQATQQMFYDDPRVLYFSIHGYQNGAFWPHLRETDYHYIGRGAGRGYNVNVPMNKIKMGNNDYMAIFQQLLLPIAYEYNPELVIVSAGYDAALGCPEGEMEVTPACYSHFTNSLMGLANGRIAVVLEGGYCLKSLSEGAALTMRTLLGDPCPVLVDNLSAPTESAQQSILSAAYVLQKYWKSLQFFEKYNVKTTSIHLGFKDRKFWPSIEFYGNDDKPEKYPTRDICPVQDPAVTAILDKELDKLINATSLSVQPNRVGFVANSVSCSDRRAKIVERCYVLSRERGDFSGDPTAGLIMNLVDSIVDGKCRSGIAMVEDLSTNLTDVLKYAVGERGLDKVMLIDWRAQRDYKIQEAFQEDSRVLHVSLRASAEGAKRPTTECEFVGVGKGEGFTINLNLPQIDNNDAAIIFSTLRVLLPVAYQYGPQLIVVVSNPSLAGSGISSEILGQAIHLLTSLAGGRLAVIFDDAQISQPIEDSVETSVAALFGDGVSLPVSVNHKLKTDSLNLIKKVIRSLGRYWDVLWYDIQLPDANVLVPPWVKDEKILQHNPELASF